MIEKRGKNSWRVGFYTSSHWVRRTIRMPEGLSETRQRREAELALARLRVEYDRGDVNPMQYGHTVRTFAEMWIKQYVDPNLKPTTASHYRQMLNSRILPMLGDVPLRELTPLRISAWLSELQASARRSTRLPEDELRAPRTPANASRLASQEKLEKPLSMNSVRHYYTCMRTMLNKAVQWDVLPRNPMARVDPPKVPRLKPNYLTEEQAVELLRCLRDEPNMQYRAALLLALLCGLRLSEVCALRLSDIDWEHETIDVSRALTYTPLDGNVEGTPKSEAGERLISLPPAMMPLLRQAKLYQEECAARAGDVWKGKGWIVHAWNGAQLHHDTPSKWFRRFADAHGFKGVRFHDLRHTHATMLLANNIDAVAVATRLGHADASTTLRIYAHALRRRDVDAAQAMQSIIERAYASPEDGDDEDK